MQIQFNREWTRINTNREKCKYNLTTEHTEPTEERNTNSGKGKYNLTTEHTE